MPPTLLNVAAGTLLGVALLGAAFDRRSIAVVALVAALPDLDAVLGPIGIGAANATLHSVFLPIGAAALLYYDTAYGDRSWLADRYGWYGVRVAWVAVAAYAVAGIAPDLFSPESAAFLYPLSDRYYAVTGGFLLSTQEGIVQTYVGVGDGWIELATPGTFETHHVDTWIDPAGEERRLRLVESGWQAVLVVTAAVAVPVKGLVERGDRAASGGR
jgi:inner membrane protein